MHRSIIGLGVLAALVLAAIFAIAPRTTIIANEVSGEIYGIDVTGVAQNADDTQAQRYAKSK